MIFPTWLSSYFQTKKYDNLKINDYILLVKIELNHKMFGLGWLDASLGLV